MALQPCRECGNQVSTEAVRLWTGCGRRGACEIARPRDLRRAMEARRRDLG
jgi:hypothetical protein